MVFLSIVMPFFYEKQPDGSSTQVERAGYNATMASKPQPPDQPTRSYRGADVPMRVIRRYARQIAERFQPNRIILFGSYAYGMPHADSDVDILVVMAARNQIDQGIRIRRALPAPFPMDLIVRTPENLGWRLAERESFHSEIVTRGKVLYEKGDSGVGAQGRSRSSRRRTPRPGKETAINRPCLEM